MCLGRYEFVAACGCRACFVGGKRSDITPYASVGHYIVGNDPCVVLYRGMLLTDLFLCERRLIPPSSVAYGASFPPRGSLPYTVRTGQISFYVVVCFCDPPSSVACGSKLLAVFFSPLKGEGFGARLSHPVLLFEEYFLMDESLKHSLYSLQNQRKASPRGEAVALATDEGG